MLAEVAFRHPASEDRCPLQLSWRCECTLFITYTSLTIKSWVPAKTNCSSVPDSNAPDLFFISYVVQNAGRALAGFTKLPSFSGAICSLAPVLALIHMKMSAVSHLMNLKHVQRHRC